VIPGRIGLRWVVAALVLATVLPLGLAAALGLRRAWRRQITTVERQNVETVRAISVAMDQEVETTTAALDFLGALHALDGPDLQAFDSLAQRLIVRRTDWSAIVLTDPRGRLLATTPARDLHDAAFRASVWAPAVAAANRSVVSPTFQMPGLPGHFVVIAIPVVRDAKVTLVLGALVRADAFSAILRRQQTPPEGLVALIDSANNIVARSRQEESYVGTPVTGAFREISSRTNEAAWQTETREGVPVYSAFSRSPRTGLTVGLALPRDQVDGPFARILLYLTAIWFGFMALAGGVALFLGQTIVRAMSSASKSAMKLARGETVVPRRSRVAEIDELATQLSDASTLLAARNRERDEASRIKDEFLMTVSHELRTPLTAIYGWARMLSTGQIRDEQRPRAAQAIERNASALQQLVNDLLDVSRIVSGRLRLDVQSVVAADVVSAAIDAVRPAAVAKQIRVTTAIPDATLRLSADPDRLRQVIWNLLSNAVKFTPAGGSIDVRVVGEAHEVALTVRDTGPGVEAEFLPHAFDRFRQGVAGTTRAHGGLGLGLAIVRHLVELHGGTVSATNNTPDAGATFRVALPALASVELRSDLMLSPEEGVVAAPSARASQLDGVSVFVVDDHQHTREMVATVLENAGADVRAAASAEDALMVLQTWQPQVMISDIEMQGQDGYELMQRVRSLSGNRQRLVALALTAHARPEDRLRALDAGFQWHLTKPIDPGELVGVIASLVAQGGEVSSPA